MRLNDVVELMRGLSFESDLISWYGELMDALEGLGVLVSAKRAGGGVFMFEVRLDDGVWCLRGSVYAVVHCVTLDGVKRDRLLKLGWGTSIGDILKVDACDLIVTVNARNESGYEERFKVTLYRGRGYVVFVDRRVRAGSLGVFLWRSFRGFGVLLVPPGRITSWRAGENGLHVEVGDDGYLIEFPRINVVRLT